MIFNPEMELMPRAGMGTLPASLPRSEGGKLRRVVDRRKIS